MTEKRKKTIRVVFTGIVLLTVYYLNATYVLNFFDPDWPVFIRKFYSREIYELSRPSPNSLFALPGIRIISVMIFSIVINAVHFVLIANLTNKKKARVFLLISLSVLFVSALFFLSEKYFPNNTNIYFLSRVLKDFALSPIIVGIFLVFTKMRFSGTKK